MKKVAIVAGEKSGDYLGAELIKEIRRRYPDVKIMGLCGPLMQEQGAKTLAEMDKISLFGLDGLFSSLKDILAIRKQLYRAIVEWQADVFIGIDVPDFNLSLEAKLKSHNIPVVHYVSPTVWAWRGGRIKKIRRSIDLMLALFPFEEGYYQQHNTPVAYVGHPLAQQVLDWKVEPQFAELYEPKQQKQMLVAVLPGSRMSEVTRLSPQMIEAAGILHQQYPQLRFVLPAANAKIKNYLSKRDLGVIEMIDGNSRDVLALCDLAVLASGTAALEAALFAKPMVVMYKVSWLSVLVFKHTIQVSHYSMPNHLTDPPAVPELIQHHATSENLITEVRKLIDDKAHYQQMQNALAAIAPRLNQPSNKLACDAIEKLLKRKSKGDI